MKAETEYFIQASSFAAPFISDTTTHFVAAASPEQALESLAEAYKHPAGLYSATCFRSADAMLKGEEPLARWLSNHVIALKERTKELGAYLYVGHGAGRFEIDGELVVVENPKQGRCVPCR